jgi:hypothetical protein
MMIFWTFWVGWTVIPPGDITVSNPDSKSTFKDLCI